MLVSHPLLSGIHAHITQEHSDALDKAVLMQVRLLLLLVAVVVVVVVVVVVLLGVAAAAETDPPCRSCSRTTCECKSWWCPWWSCACSSTC